MLELCLPAVAAATAMISTAGALQIEPDTAEDRYVQGNLLFLAYHEAGHLILDQVFDADQRADRRAAEEIADDIATWLLLPDPDEPDQDEELFAAIMGWIQSASEAGATTENPHYPSDENRASRIACLLYGGNPELYADLAEALWEDGSESVCVEEHESLQNDLEEWLGDAFLGPDEQSDAAVNYEYREPDGADPDIQYAYEYVMGAETLEDFAQDIVDFVRLPQDIAIVADVCGEGQAEFKYSAEALTITVCYEAVDWFIKRAALGPDALGPSAAASGSGGGGGGDLGSGGNRVKKKPVRR
jgi:hypothetical protein